MADGGYKYNFILKQRQCTTCNYNGDKYNWRKFLGHVNDKHSITHENDGIFKIELSSKGKRGDPRKDLVSMETKYVIVKIIYRDNGEENSLYYVPARARLYAGHDIVPKLAQCHRKTPRCTLSILPRNI